MSQPDPALTELHSIRDFIRLAVSRFRAAELYYGHGTDNSWDEAVQLVLHGAGLPWDVDRSVIDARLLMEEKQAILELIRRRIDERIPAPYLIGEAWFVGQPFYVDSRVLIPRSPIGQLIANGFEPWLGDLFVSRVLDLCTGSGCIGIACAQLFEEADVDLVDISADALDVARQNISRHDLGDRVQAIESDLFSKLEGRKYQIIVSNPPYVDADDFSSMPAEFEHEPVLGLVSGHDGLDCPRAILRAAADYLTDDGLLIMEVGNSEQALQRSYPDVPFIWIDLPEGGNGVFMLSAQDLRQYRDRFVSPEA